MFLEDEKRTQIARYTKTDNNDHKNRSDNSEMQFL
mgnify:CR=1 FL=1